MMAATLLPRSAINMSNKIVVVQLGGCTVEVKAQNIVRNTDGAVVSISCSILRGSLNLF